MVARPCTWRKVQQTPHREVQISSPEVLGLALQQVSEQTLTSLSKNIKIKDADESFRNETTQIESPNFISFL